MRKQRLDITVTDGWIAMMQHYFVAAWVRRGGSQDSFYTNVLGDGRYIIGRFSPAVSLAPGTATPYRPPLRRSQAPGHHGRGGTWTRTDS